MKPIFLTAFSLAILSQVTARADVVYDTIPSSLAANYTSQAYQATQTSGFGDAITLANSPVNARAATSATVLLSNWAKQSDWTTYPLGNAAGYYEPMTLTLYNYATPGPDPKVGSIVAQSSTLAFIPWRPPTDVACAGNDGYSSGGNCYHGIATPVTFTFNGESLPDNVIFGLTFNTETYGANPTGVDGPYDSLNYALVPNGPTVGTDADPNGVEWNTATQGWLTTGTAGAFGPDSSVANWGGSVPGFTLQAVPEPATMAILLPAIFGLVASRRRRA
jgi:hypothetical protein